VQFLNFLLKYSVNTNCRLVFIVYFIVTVTDAVMIPADLHELLS